MTRRILLAEDDAAVRTMLSEALQERGFEITACPSGTSAVETMRSAAFDAAVFDMQLPGFSGVELFCRFRQGQPETPAFVMSGAMTPTTIETLNALGAKIVEKPFSLGAMVESIEAAAEDHSHERHLSVLIVDDEPALRGLLEDYLGEKGYAVATAGDGAEALRLLRTARHPFDIALVDINMPHVNGIGLIREMDEIWPETLPIVITGEAVTAQVSEAYRAGAYTMLTKPLHIPALAKLLAGCGTALAERRSRAEARRTQASRPPLRKALDAVKGFWNARPGTRSAEVRNGLGACAAVIVAALVIQSGMETARNLISSEVDRTASALFGGTNAARGAETGSGRGVERLDEFVSKVEGYLERDEQRELHRPSASTRDR